ncbi:DNA excision repair protein (Rad5) [Rasamsonia emersonii CBS 393.64]|uniref:DNA excision repair protein (Rad5) n=1 Tax=Rasamsonia emersonii (strain ATCC 16479 / CBS 393.64 / IMI 116815) TaxID=1408163 RepID=A0A0F4YWV6_RASE3|nr:DNA excision repair protein (Rad5) [Rasamsonia emersonii CBS 393.64]KKA22777.1 DNA excision repair protein (Rad5) [Rasamsonia emersonii CBS 393.64]
MSFGDVDERPTKKRRFFVEEEDEQPLSRDTPDASQEAFAPRNLENGTGEREDALSLSGNGISVEDAEHKRRTTYHPDVDTSSNGVHRHEPVRDQQPPVGQQENGSTFDTELFSSIVGQEIPQDTMMQIRAAANDNMERAINMFFDGSWKNASRTASSTIPQQPSRADIATASTTTAEEPQGNTETRDTTDWKPPEGAKVLTSMPYHRYIGAFGVAAWATRSGTNLIRHDEPVKIERTRSQPLTKLRRGGKVVVNQKADVLTRFTNQRGEEIGRLPRETAEWVSTLIDQGICDFEGVCVFAPDRIRVNDTIYLQLRCYLLKDAFHPDNFKSLDDNRSTGLFEQQESLEERELRLRQVALVKLFDEINLLPTSTNETTVKHKKEGLLRAAEMAEQYDKNKKDNHKDTNEPGDSSQEEESAELEEDQLDTLYKKAQSFDFSTPEAQPAETFVMNLRKYQKQALHWMLAKEKDAKLDRQTSMHPLWEEYKWPTKDVDDKVLPCVYRQDYFYVNPYSGELSLEFPVQEQRCLGGILADEMGLGKTIEMLSLIHSNRIMPDADGSVNGLPRLPKSSTGVVPAPYTTLVVAPTSLLSQWESEANKASAPGSLRTVIYYGADRSVNLKTLCSAANGASAPHLIITSYGVVLSEYRSLASRPLLSAGGHSGLFSLEFFRVILDEAHLIKNRRSKSARACYELKAIHRWVLTVPFESKDYVRALNVVQTVLEPLVLRRTKTMKTPEGEALVPLPPRTITIEEVELSQQEREIYDYIYTRAKRTFNDNVEAGTLLKSYSTIFAQILRLRQTCCHPVLTRNKTIVAEEEEAAAAADEANDLKDDMDLQELIDRFTASTEAADSNQQQDASMRFSAHALRQIQNESSGECPICSEEPMIEPAVTGCWHSACKKCLEDFVRHQTDKGEVPRCFSCRAPVTRRDIFEVVRHRSPNSTADEQDLYSSSPPSSSQPAPKISLRRIYPLSPSAHTSAKIHALISHLTRLPPNTKAVVFSQFTSFLDLIGPQLTRAGISHLRLDGTMPQKARAEVLRQFTSTETYEEELEDDDLDATPRKPSSRPKGPTQNQSPTVLLMSLRAGGVGLNLTAASHVYMMDPWWSFAVEAQAIDRVHRMGQLREVSVTRFVVKDSIEGRMLRVQERKMNIAGTLGLRVGGDGSEEERRKERIEELKLLFE